MRTSSCDRRRQYQRRLDHDQRRRTRGGLRPGISLKLLASLIVIRATCGSRVQKDGSSNACTSWVVCVTSVIGQVCSQARLSKWVSWSC